MKILLVDDSKAMRMIVMRQMRQIGFGDSEFLEATNGKEALETILADRPSLVLSDWNMPEMNGLELLRALNERQVKIPFGFVTSEGNPEMRQLAADEGAKFLVAKPFTADDLDAALVALR
jgi:two-component system, chemotaxis family, chemotaxis protein CheY